MHTMLGAAHRLLSQSCTSRRHKSDVRRASSRGVVLERPRELETVAVAQAASIPNNAREGDLRPVQFATLMEAPSTLTTSAIARATNKTIEQISGRKQQLLVAYQGVPGAYSEGAARLACPNHEPLPCHQFEVAFQALSQWMSDRACLPIENSLGGSIHAVYDLLLRYNLHIVGEKSVPINHCLMANKGVKIEDLKRVMSHPQALAQVDQYLRDLNVVKEAVDDTAGAAQLVAKNGWMDVGAVASRRAADLYGLDILAEGIQDMADNVTRFIVLSRDPLVQTSEIQRGSTLFKTSIVFSLTEGPGSLFKALSCFALRDIDMTKIESRPMRSNPIVISKAQETKRLNYLFYVDVLGSVADPNCQNALKHLQEFAPFLRVLGSYPVDQEFLAT